MVEKFPFCGSFFLRRDLLYGLTVWDETGLCRLDAVQACAKKKKKNIFGASDLEHCLPKNLVKRTARGIETSIFKTEVQHAIHDATGALLSRNFASDSLYLLRLQRAWFSMVYREEGLCEKTTFQALKKCFLHTNPMKLRQARLCKKNNFSGFKKMFFTH